MDSRDSVKQEIQLAIDGLERNEIKSSIFPLNYEYLDGLNEMQKIAATRLEGNYLVIAGPGAGKTHTLLYRILHMVKMGIPAQEICIVTFTRKAADQLKRRIKLVLPEAELGFIGTIHALAFTLILRSTSSPARLIDPADDLMVLKLAIEEYSLKLPMGTKRSTIHKIIDYSAVTMKTIEDSLIDLNKEDILADDIKKIQHAYVEYKKKNGYINYSDAIILAGGASRERLQYLMIDEYQDTDPCQLLMLKSLDFPNVMAIGDDFQSIYSFRGADNKIILNFGQDFSNAKVIKLNVNYRSTDEIVQAENVITNATDYGYKKELVSNRGSENFPIQFLSSEYEQSEFILQKIKEFLTVEGQSKVAMIYRYNRQKYIIEPLLLENKIEYVVYGGVKLLERKHIKDLCAVLLTNRNKNDFISYMRSLMLLDGVGEVGAKKLIRGEANFRRADLLELQEIINKEYPDIHSILQEVETFYLGLDSVLTKSSYTVEEIKDDFQIINNLATNYASINNFITDIILDGNKDKWSTKNKNAKVVLTTIHSAKGLEFEDVHFLYSPKREFDIEKAEENRRLFYTAISRAKNRLFIYDAWRRENILDIISDFEIDTSLFSTTLSMNTAANDFKFESDSDTSFLSKEEERSLTIDTLVNADREILDLVEEAWQEIINNVSRPTYRTLLSCLNLEISSKERIIVTYQDVDEKNMLLNWQKLKFELKPLLEIVTTKHLDILCISSKEYLEYTL